MKASRLAIRFAAAQAHARGEDGRRAVDLTRSQHGRRESGLVRGVGKVLRLQRHAVSLPVGASAGADERAVEIAAAVELDSRLGRPDGQGAATVGIAQGGGFDQGGVAGRAVEHDVVVVAAADEQLRVTLADAGPDRRRGREIEGGVLRPGPAPRSASTRRRRGCSGWRRATARDLRRSRSLPRRGSSRCDW